MALDIPFARLLEPQANQTQVIRRGEGTKVVAEQANYQAILLAACPPGARRDIYLLLTQPGADRISHPHPPGSVEHIIITQGRARVGLTEAPEELGKGITSATRPIGNISFRRWSRIPGAAGGRAKLVIICAFYSDAQKIISFPINE